ncbi:MAG: hypothetical protein WCP08_02630 [Prolixibacteraceae bacterium]
MTINNIRVSAISFFGFLRNRKGIALVFLVAFLLSITSLYAKDKEMNYLKNGVSFSLPGDWKTISDESLPDKGFYYSAERSGKNATGLFSLVTIHNEENPVKSLLIQQKNMKDEALYKDSGIEFTEIENNRFGSMEAKSVRYESVVKGIKVSGTIYCFNCAEKTYLLFFQTGIDDLKKNTKAFKLIEITFACR